MCEEKDRSKKTEVTSEQSGSGASSSTTCDGDFPDCCGPVIEKMMKAFGGSSTDPQKASPGDESQPSAGTSCGSMMRRMMDMCDRTSRSAGSS